jgi:hypothetical protein
MLCIMNVCVGIANEDNFIARVYGGVHSIQAPSLLCKCGRGVCVRWLTAHLYTMRMYVMMAGTTQSSRSLTKSPTTCTWTKGNTQQQGQRRLQEVMQVAVVQQNMRLRELWSASDVPWRRLCQAVQHQRMGGCFYPHAQSLPASAAREHMAWHVLPGEQRRWQQHQHEYQYNPLNSNPECIVSCILYLIHYTHNAHLIYLYTYNLVPCSHPHPHRQPHAHPQTRTQPPGSSRVL